MLEKLKFTGHIPTLTDVHREILRMGVTTAFQGIIVNGIRRMEISEDDAMSRLIQNTEEDKRYRFDMIANMKCRKSIMYLIKYFDRKGFFN